MKKRLLYMLSTLILISLLLSACSGAQEVAAKLPLRLGWTLWPGWYPLVLADQKGFFKEHGIEVQIISYGTAEEVTAALASGMIDGGFMVMNDMLLDSVSANAKAVLITDNSNGADQVVSTEAILSADDIRGKRIGTQRGSFSEFFIREMLNQKGISSSDVTLVNVNPETVPAAMPAAIDIGHTYEPFTSAARAKGYTVIFSSADTPGLIVDIAAFRKNVIEERPEDVKAFVAAWFESLQYWQKNPQASNVVIARITNQKAENISTEGVKLFDLAANLKAFKPGTDTTSVYFTARKAMKFLIDSGFIAKPVNIDDALDASFLE